MLVSRLQLTRDSVCAGDDCDAPHRRTMTFDPPVQLLAAIGSAVGSKYLASIAGGKASWVALLDSEAIAVVAQQWDEPKFLPNVDYGIPRADVNVHFCYHAQRNPKDVYSIYSSRNG